MLETFFTQIDVQYFLGLYNYFTMDNTNFITRCRFENYLVMVKEDSDFKNIEFSDELPLSSSNSFPNTDREFLNTYNYSFSLSNYYINHIEKGEDSFRPTPTGEAMTTKKETGTLMYQNSEYF